MKFIRGMVFQFLSAISVGKDPMSKHIHQFQRRAIGKNKDYIVYACVVPDCFTYYPEDIIVGKQTRCNRCKANVTTIKRNTANKIPHKPHCEDCTHEPRNPNLRSIRPSQAAPKETVNEFVKSILDWRENNS